MEIPDKLQKDLIVEGQSIGVWRLDVELNSQLPVEQQNAGRGCYGDSVLNTLVLTEFKEVGPKPCWIKGFI